MTEPVMVGGNEPANASRLPLLLGIGAALLLAVIVLPGLLGGGDDEEEFDFGVTPTSVPGATTTTLPSDVDVTPPPRTFEIFSSKNPFTPLADTGTGTGTAPGGGTGTSPDGVVLPPPPGGTASPPPSDGSVIIVQPSDGTSSPPSDGDTTTSPPSDGDTTTSPPPDDGTDPTTQPRSNEPRASQRVELLEVFSDDAQRLVATVRVNDTVYEVGEGDAFASNYQVVSLSQADGCGQFLFGDDRFRLCEGEQLRK